MSNKYVVVDLETTGHSPKKGDKIIQFAAVVVENGKIVEKFSSLVNPRQHIPVFIEELTGLTDSMVKEAPLFSEIAPTVLTMLEGAYFVAHNVLFDLSFLQEELIEAGYDGFFGPVLDTVEMARVLLPTADSYKLNELAIREGLEHDRPHQADSDAYVTAELLIILLEKLQNLPKRTILQLLKYSGGLRSDIALLLDEVVLEKGSRVEEISPELELYRGLALKKVPENPESLDEYTVFYPEQDDEKEELFRRAFSKFEKRTGQFRMMDHVYHSFLEKKHAVIEAGTGVGKSIAYLLPAAILAKGQDETVVISTHTIQLQEQLLTKDIPLLQRMLPWKVKTSILKGRNHYISLAKFEQTLKEEDDNYDTSLTKMQILVWLTETTTGDRDELNLSSGGNLFWNKIKNDETIFFQNKAWLLHDYYFRARKDAQTSNLIITNHSLLLTDLVSNHSILPAYQYCVIDEGHHFEKSAGKHFGASIDYLTIRLLLNQFGQYEQKQYFYMLEELLRNKIPEMKKGLLHTNDVNQIFINLTVEMDEFFRVIGIYLNKHTKKSSLNRVSCRLSLHDHTKESQAVIAIGERFSYLLKDIMNYLDDSLHALKKSESTYTNKQKKLIEDILTFRNELDALRGNLRSMIIKPEEDCVAWIEMDIRSIQNATTIYTQPVTISNKLREQFFDKKESIIITSATLSVKNSFRYIMNALGLHSQDCTVELIQSPFNYEEQVNLLIPTDLPEVNTVPLDDYVVAITEHIISLAEATKGRMLILFTSYEMLKKTYTLMKESGLLEDFVIMGQGISGGSRTRLTRNFQRFDKAILLGTSSFWEGVDIPGEDLTCLIIVRLPFSPPNEPLTQAKSEIIKKSGGNPFSEYSLPEAIIRFKQGFGRLIRTSHDRGFVVVFDGRLQSTTYGKAFLQSIPPVPVRKFDINEMVEFIETWL